MPVGCGGVAVFPGDAVVGDGEGVVVVPAHLADDVAAEAEEQELKEEFITGKIRAGAPLHGTYPLDEEGQREFEEWRRNRSR